MIQRHAQGCGFFDAKRGLEASLGSLPECIANVELCSAVVGQGNKFDPSVGFGGMKRDERIAFQGAEGVRQRGPVKDQGACQIRHGRRSETNDLLQQGVLRRS